MLSNLKMKYEPNLTKIETRIILIQKISFFRSYCQTFPIFLLCNVDYLQFIFFSFSFADDKSLEKIDDDSKSEPESLEEGEVR